MVAEVSNNAFVNKSSQLEIDLKVSLLFFVTFQSDSCDSSNSDDSVGKELSEREKRRRRAERRSKKNAKRNNHDDEVEEPSVGASSEVKLEMIHNLSSAKLLMISE
jgi:hypothetical protein